MIPSKSSHGENDPFKPRFSTMAEIDQAVEILSANRQKWAEYPIKERIAIAEEIHHTFPKVWNRWVDFAVAAKGISHRHAGNDREWIEIATINRIHTALLGSLKEIEKYGRPKVPGGYRVLSNGRVAARVYPDHVAHGLAFRGIRMDVWLKSGMSVHDAVTKQAFAYRHPPDGKVALVLGAGNASSLPSSDTLHKLFHDLCVVVLKMNPVNSYLGPLLEETYGILIENGFLRIVYGGGVVGEYLVHHECVEEVHMTGSDRTFETIVFGGGEEGIQRKKAGKPLVNKSVDGELGCITPWIIIPGKWKTSDIQKQAAKMAFWMMRHEGYICFAPRIVVLQKKWPYREAFLKALAEALSKVEPINAYYPGSAETQKAFVEAHPEAIQIGGGQKGKVPWTLIPDLDPNARDEVCYRRESFSGLCGEVSMDGNSVPDFLNRAVTFLNNVVWGTLSVTLVVNEKTLRDPVIADAVDQAIEDLHYGTVALNGPGTWGFYTMKAPWGGYPGSKLTDIQSGNSHVSNFLMLHSPEKTVIRAPFRMWPYPFLGTAENLDVFSRHLAQFEFKPDFRGLLRLFWSGIQI